MSTMMSDDFILDEELYDDFKMWQGLVGPYYYPTVDDAGNLSWTNNGGLANPGSVNIQGRGLTIVGIVEDVSELPQTADDYVTYLVGEEAPYEGYIYSNGTWVDLGIVGRGEQGIPGVSPTVEVTAITGGHQVEITDAEGTTTFDVMDGEGVPTGGTTGQVLKKSSSTDFDTEWGSVEALPTGGTTGQVLAKASSASYDVEWVDQSGGTVESVNNVTPDQNGNITLTADDIGTDATNISIQDALDDYVYVGTSAPTDPTTKIWLDTDEPGMSAVSSVNGKTGTVVLDLDDIGFMTLLWTNASPSSSFAAQTVSLDLSGYDAVFVISNLMTTGENNTGVFVRKGLATETNIVMYGAIVAASAMTVQRRGVTATDTGVVFSDAKLKAATSNSAGSTENSRCIPLYIYGIKGVTA